MCVSPLKRKKSQNPSPRILRYHRTNPTFTTKENREQRTENREQRTENREQRTENREQRTENREQRTENREQRTENGEQRTERNGPTPPGVGLQPLKHFVLNSDSIFDPLIDVSLLNDEVKQNIEACESVTERFFGRVKVQLCTRSNSSPRAIIWLIWIYRYWHRCWTRHKLDL